MANEHNEDTDKLYKIIYKTSQMGAGSTSTVLSSYKGSTLCDELSRRGGEYSSIFAEAKTALGGKPEGSGLTAKEKFMTSQLIRMKLMTNGGDSRAAEIMIKGCNMGIINTIKAKKSCPTADDGAKGLADRLINFQCDTVEKMKPFL